MTRSPETPMPPRSESFAGGMRRLGVELEFGGLEIDAISARIEAELGGSIEVVSDYEHRVRDTELGDFAVELDYEYLKKVGRDGRPGDDEASLLDHVPENLLADIARQFVPLEVVSPPLPMDRLARLDGLVARLRDAGALGSRHSPAYAFGLHFNPEMPALDARTIAAYLRAFVCLYEWLRRAGEVDWVRRLTPYADPFATGYVRRIISSDYAPSLPDLIDDYLEWNPDRNRALDMLPLFVHLDEARVRAVVDDPRVQARPTLHYRLPNCDIDRPDWGVLVAWRHWLEVEYLADDEERLATVCAAYVEHLDDLAERAFGDWASTCEQWLKLA